MRVESLEDVKRLLRDWAYWHRTGHGWVDACPLGRVLESTRSGTPGSRIPTGVSVPAWCYEVDQAMCKIESLDQVHSEAMAVVRMVYLRPRGTMLEAVAEVLDITASTLERRRLIGERALLVWYRSRQESMAA